MEIKYAFFRNPLRWLSASVVAIFFTTQYSLGAMAPGPFVFLEQADSEFQETGESISSVTKFVFFILYMISGAFMAASGFKLSSGDIPGFIKMVAGGIFMFLAPKLIFELSELGAPWN